MVGCTLRLRSTRRWPARLVVDCVDCCSALTRSLSDGAEGELAADAEHGRQRHALQQLPGVEIDLVGEAGVAAGVGGRQVVDHDRAAVGQDDALPDDERALLAEGDDVVVLADETGALRDQQVAARDGVVDVLGHLGDDEARQIRVEAADQAGGDDGAGHQLVGRGRLLQAVRIVDLLLGAGFQEGELARLVGGVVRQPIEIAGGERRARSAARKADKRRQIAVRR